MTDPVLAEQITYYRARAGEYDEWWQRQGRYDQGQTLNAVWRQEVDQLRAFVEPAARGKRILELAGGTGIWSQLLAQFGSAVTVVDASPEVLAINHARLNDPRVQYIQADLFSWAPERVYDLVFFGFWLSHVPHEQFDPFWSLVARSLAPGGQAIFVDSARPSTERESLPETAVSTRELNDGRRFQIYKRFYDPPRLMHDLQILGWSSDVRATPTYFIYGSAQRSI
jgi:SAM-dependent methyltransferase